MRNASIIIDEGNEKRSTDLYSKLVNDRVLFLEGEVNTDMANDIIAKLLYLESVNPIAPIIMYINSPGGSVIDGLAIRDVMEYISCPVHTIAIGMCASMGAFLLASGEKGHRLALKNSQIMIHQLSGGSKGKLDDMRINYEHALRLNDILMDYLSEYTQGKTDREEMEKLCKMDNWLTIESAINIGIIDGVVEKRKL